MIMLFLFATVLFAAISLATGASFLSWGLPGGLPLGNLVVAGGLVAGAMIPLRIMPGGYLFRWAAWANMLLALGWLPLGWVLAGNIGLNFVDDASASSAFHGYTLVAGIAVPLMILATWARVIYSALELGEFDE